MATVHLISGLPCSGKSSYAARLESQIGALRLSLDQHLISVFGRYSIAEVGNDEHVRRVLSTREAIWATAASHLDRGTDVILDDGFFYRRHRLIVIERCKERGARSKIHFCHAPVSVLRTRLEARNARLPPHNFSIDPDLLDKFVLLFEHPSDDEGAELEWIPS
jgi:predicted kinase